jgi:hypothetical protein
VADLVISQVALDRQTYNNGCAAALETSQAGYGFRLRHRQAEPAIKLRLDRIFEFDVLRRLKSPTAMCKKNSKQTQQTTATNC